MLQKIVILGNQFVCDKRLCSLVQKTITMEDVEVENYLHLHKFFKDQRAIIVDASIMVSTGYIFTGEAFVNPISLQSYSIDGEIDEEELDTTAPNSDDEALVERVIGKIIRPIVERMDKIQLGVPGAYYTEFPKPKQYQVVCGSVNVRTGPTTHFQSVRTLYRGQKVTIYGIDGVFMFGYMGDGLWITVNEKYLQEIPTDDKKTSRS